MIATQFANALVATNGDPDLREETLTAFEPHLLRDDQPHEDLSITMFCDGSTLIALREGTETLLSPVGFKDIPNAIFEVNRRRPDMATSTWDWLMQIITLMTDHADATSLPG